MDQQTDVVILFAAAAICTHLIRLKRIKQTRRLWSEKWLLRRHENRGVLYLLENELRLEDPLSYKSFIRMCETYFGELLNIIKNDISKEDTNVRECVSPAHRLAITLRFLASGDSYRSLMFATRVHESTISLIVPEVCKAIFKNLKEKYLKLPHCQNEWKIIAKEFEMLWNIPLCVGALDGKHINFRAPRSTGSYYYNYKGDHSIVLLALCDAKYKFTYIDVGVNGRISDGGVYRESSLKRGLDLNLIQFPDDECLPGQTNPIPYIIVADDAFPLCKRILKPYSFRGLTKEKRICNYRISRARRVIENSFGILANRFRILLNTINLNPMKVEDITLSCCVLHNFLLSKSDKTYLDIDLSKTVSSLENLHQQQSGNRSTREALLNRDSFCNYFNTVGAVQWQNKCLE